MTQSNGEKETLRDFTRNPVPYLERIRGSGEALVLSVEGEADVVVQDAESYRRLWEQVERLETLAAIREGIEDVAAGRTRPAREVLAELAKKYNLEAVYDIDANRANSDQEVRDGNRRLVNLAKDLTESKDLSKENADKAKALEDAWKKWNADLPAPPARRADKPTRR